MGFCPPDFLNRSGGYSFHQLEPEFRAAMFARAVVIHWRDRLNGSDRWNGQESSFATVTGDKPRHAWDVRQEARHRRMRRDEARNLRMAPEKARHGAGRRLLRLVCCNFQEPARGLLQKPR